MLVFRREFHHNRKRSMAISNIIEVGCIKQFMIIEGTKSSAILFTENIALVAQGEARKSQIVLITKVISSSSSSSALICHSSI